MSKVELVDINKNFNKTTALKDINLKVHVKEFLVVLGPSGSGKSTLLNIISGLEQPSSGKVYLREEYSNKIPPNLRNLGMVFQNNSLYPNMSVYKNLEFGLKINGMPENERREKIGEISKLLKINDKLERLPATLSGGEKQRVALGRALIKDTELFLMDEPLSDLDIRTKENIKSEIKKLYDISNSTFIYVTHDQKEALSLATRIAILDKGIIKQIGTPEEIYEDPNSIFVADFVGSPKINLIRGGKNNKYIVGFRPENIKVTPQNNYLNLDVKFIDLEYYGDKVLGNFSLLNDPHTKIAGSFSKDATTILPTLNKLYIHKENILYFNPKTKVRINLINKDDE